MTLDEAFHELRARNEPVPTPMRLPSESEVSAAEQSLAVPFHADYRRFLLEVSDVVYGTIEPFVLTAPDSHIDLLAEVREAWSSGVPQSQLPFCGDDGNYFCIDSAGVVRYWDHDGTTDEKWPDLAGWITSVWLEED